MRNEVNNHTHKKGVIAQKVIILILSLIILVFLITPILVNALKGKDLLPEFVHREMKTLKYNLEGAANVYLPLLLDLSIGTLDWKKDTIMLYAALLQIGKESIR